MKNPKISLIQFMVGNDREDNIARAFEMVRKAAADGADIVVLPEMFYCPYQTDNFPLYAQERYDEIFTRMSSLAQELNIYLFAGSVPEKEDEKIYNTAYCFNRGGELIASHRKMHLFDIAVAGGQTFKESNTLTAGESVTIADTEFGKIGLCVCYDFRFPELARLMAIEGASMIIVPGAFNMTTGPLHWELLFRSRAMENTLYTVGVAPARDENFSYVSYANSIICSPWGQLLANMGTKEGIHTMTLDLSEVTKARNGLPMLKQRRTDIYTLEVK